MSKNEQLLSDDEVVTVIVHLDLHIGSALLTNFYKSIAKFKLNSNIIINNNIEISNELIYHTKHISISSPPQLLYRGTRDGFKAIDFHSKCDNQGPTLTIIKSSEPYNQIFGGFTTQNWKSSNSGGWISDDLAFIFKIDDVDENSSNQQRQQQLFRKFTIKEGMKQKAICVSKKYLPIFGTGHDICITSDCNLNNKSYSSLGFTYESLNGDEFQFGSEKAKNYLAGSEYFQVSEIEVFKIDTTIQ